jgi:hypothetical protein
MIASRHGRDVVYGAYEMDARRQAARSARDGRPDRARAGEFGWKIMDETQGPNASKCPRKFALTWPAPAVTRTTGAHVAARTRPAADRPRTDGPPAAAGVA